MGTGGGNLGYKLRTWVSTIQEELKRDLPRAVERRVYMCGGCGEASTAKGFLDELMLGLGLGGE